MRVTSTWNEELQFDTVSDSGHRVTMDAGDAHAAGPSPMESVLMALCACSSTDVISILKKKREPVTSLTVSAVAERAPDPPRVFTRIQLLYRVGGAVSQKAIEDAVALSKDKYCSVSQMLEKTAAIEFKIERAASEQAADLGRSNAAGRAVKMGL